MDRIKNSYPVAVSEKRSIVGSNHGKTVGTAAILSVAETHTVDCHVDPRPSVLRITSFCFNVTVTLGGMGEPEENISDRKEKRKDSKTWAKYSPIAQSWETPISPRIRTAKREPHSARAQDRNLPMEQVRRR